MRHALILALAALSACSGGKVVQDRPVRVAIPIPAPCAFTRPARPVPLKDSTPDWDTLDVRQKAALVGKQAIELRTYGEQLDAATMACK